MNLEQSTIKIRAEERGIERLCHFTRLSSLPFIIDSGGLFSTYRLKSSRRYQYLANDHHRLDGHPDHICLSITVPNARLMWTFASKDSSVDWVVLWLDTSPLWASGSKFCAVNAAKDSGRHIGSGSAAFAKLFEGKPPASSFTRCPNHRTDCPTDVQAEVLVEAAIRFEHVKGIFVKSFDDARKVQGILNSNSHTFPALEIRVLKSSFFRPEEVKNYVEDRRVPFPAWEEFRRVESHQ